MRKILLLLLFLSQLSKVHSAVTVNKNTGVVAILIHGTWGLESDWHRPGAPFYDALQYDFCKAGINLIDFNWSGKLSYQKRQEAGKNLANLINSYPPNTHFILVTHSHGGNVGIIASQLLKKDHQIIAFYSLGLPVDVKSYLPNMQAIKKFYNIFSFDDTYQTAFGMHERILPAHKNIYNINIEINHQKPQHEALHSLIIAKWLTWIDKDLNNFKNCDNHFFAEFYDHCMPKISVETRLTQKLNFDALWHKKICIDLLRD